MKQFRSKMLRAAGWVGSTLVIAFAAVLSGGCDVGTGSTPADAPEPTVHVQVCDWGPCDSAPEPVETAGPVPTDSAGNPLW